MNTFCAWCKKSLKTSNENEHPEFHPVSHGICIDCAKTMFSELTESLDSFLNRFDMPILVIDPNENVIAANKKAMERARLEASDLKGMRCGDVLQCAHATEKGGCGRTIHCQSCVIRNSVLYTFKTGEPKVRIPAFPDLQQYDETKKRKLLISTEKVGGMVFLKIEDDSADSKNKLE